MLRRAFPYLDRNPGLREEVHARVRFWAWMTLRKHARIRPAYRELEDDVDAQALLGFHGGLPCYDTLRDAIHHRFARILHDLVDALLCEEKRLLPALGARQVQDATPIEARRREATIPFHPYYEARVHRLDLRWDLQHEALLAHQFYRGLAHEGRWLPVFTKRLARAGIRAEGVTTDNGYVSLAHVALQWRAGQPLWFKRLDEWRVDEAAARTDVQKRYQSHRRHPAFMPDAPWEARVRFLIDHGTPHDVEAAGRWLRDHALTTRTSEQAEAIRRDRSQNEGLNAALKDLPLAPTRRGSQEMLRRAHACVLTTHAIQLTRLQHGITHGLCRTTYIL